MTLELWIHPHRSAEKHYACQLLLTELLGIEFSIRWSEQIQGYQFRLSNGRILELEDHFWPNAPTKGYQREQLPTSSQVWNVPFIEQYVLHLYGNPGCVATETGFRVSSDWLASTFLMATRWEETLPGERDRYGRFPAAASLAVQMGFLDRPVVHEWAEALWALLLLCGWPAAQRSHRQARVLLSCDVDHPRHWNRPLDRLKTIVGAWSRPDPLPETYFWIKKGFFLKKDPFDTFEEWMDLGEQLGHPVDFHFLGKRPKHFDCWYELNDPYLQKRMQRIALRGHSIGFHPSREAAIDPQRFQDELESLRQVAPTEIRTGRHHYLCFKGDSTWRTWVANGLELDRTLGYPEQPGFRCGLCVEYPVFDLENSQVLPLREQPLVAMDVTLALYNRRSPEESGQVLQRLLAQTRRFNGDFTFLWHNSSFNTYFWAPYQEVFRTTLLSG